MRVFDRVHKRAFDLSKIQEGLFFVVSIESVGYKKPHYDGFSKEQHSVVVLKVMDRGTLISRFEFDFWLSRNDLETLKLYKQGLKFGPKYGSRYVKSLGIKKPFKQTMTELISGAVEGFLSDASTGYCYEDVNDFAQDLGFLSDGESLTYDEMEDKMNHIKRSFNTCVGYWEELTRALEHFDLDAEEAFSEIQELFQERQGYKVMFSE